MLTPYLPYGLVVKQLLPNEFTIIEPPGRSLAGQLTVPLTAGRDITFADLLIPSNGRFNQEDLRVLWEAGEELATWRSARVALARNRGFGEAAMAGPGELVTDWRSLAACAHDAAALLRNWPSVLDRQATWLPIGVPGGTEDILTTEREVAARQYLVATADGLHVTQSRRWTGQRRPLRSATVSALAQAVINLVHTSVPGQQLLQLRPLLTSLTAVAHRAAAPPGHRDPDPSSLPLAFTTFARSCTVTLARLESSRRGTGAVPLLDTDEMYEAWLAMQTRQVLENRFGASTSADSEALGTWQHDGTSVQLWMKPVITRHGRQVGTVSFQAVVAETLTPDLALTAIRGDDCEFAIIDAKSWLHMLPEDALTQSAKYLYGIRRSDNLTGVPAIAGVDLVTCAPPPAIWNGRLAGVTVLGATPTVGVEKLQRRISQIVDRLHSVLLDRAYPAPSW